MTQGRNQRGLLADNKSIWIGSPTLQDIMVYRQFSIDTMHYETTARRKNLDKGREAGGWGLDKNSPKKGWLLSRSGIDTGGKESRNQRGG